MASSTTVPATAVHRGRIRVLRKGSSPSATAGPVVYWMFRDQRVRDNWALHHALHLARRTNSPVAVFFNLFPRFLGAHARQLCFMLRGLRRLHASLRRLQVPFFLFRGEAVENLPRFVKECGAKMVVTDFTPLREVRRWKEEICEVLEEEEGVAVCEVDAHNVVPVWAASGKLEYSAKTLRAKIHRLLPEYLGAFPEIRIPDVEWKGAAPPEIDWDQLIDDVRR